jgi:hypothetical protein
MPSVLCHSFGCSGCVGLIIVSPCREHTAAVPASVTGWWGAPYSLVWQSSMLDNHTTVGQSFSICAVAFYLLAYSLTGVTSRSANLGPGMTYQHFVVKYALCPSVCTASQLGSCGATPPHMCWCAQSWHYTHKLLSLVRATSAAGCSLAGASRQQPWSCGSDKRQCLPSIQAMQCASMQ